jgi:hypothetical protein
MKTEHETFLKLTNSLNEAISAVQMLGVHRPDQKFLWDMVADGLTRMKDTVYETAMKGVN